MGDIKRKVLKLSLLGDQAVGKTCICNCYLGLEFSETNLSTIGHDKIESTMIMDDGVEMKLLIWDTAGQERFKSIALSSIKSSQGILIVFDVTKRKTFENVSQWLSQINEQTNNASMVIIGNKCDADSDKREVTETEAAQFAKDNNLPYFETSAKMNINIKEAFTTLAKEAYKNYGTTTNLELNTGNKEGNSGGCCKKKSKSN